jgi:hypothetical protein
MKPGRGNIGSASDHPLINSLVFTWAFMEVIWWFWVCLPVCAPKYKNVVLTKLHQIYTNLREERAEAMSRIMQRKKEKAELELNSY